MTETLTEEQKKDIQDRFAHVLRSYRYSENITQSELAEKIGFTLPYIAKLENRKDTNNKAITSLEFLEKFAKFCGGMSLSSFVAYLRDGGFSENGSPWDFVKTDIFPNIRSNLQHKVLGYFKRNKKDIDRINNDLETMINFIELSNNDKAMVKDFIDRMRKK